MLNKWTIVPVQEVEKSKVTDFFITHWGSAQMVVSSGIFQCDELDGFLALEDTGAILGLCTYTLAGNDCEMISLDSVAENQGTGTALIRRLEEEAQAKGCESVSLITTNDNLHALGFYQRRGYSIVGIFPQAVEKARRIKPEIPLVADNGIPIQDEILLRKKLKKPSGA
jgi:ribosomal protein S18 acetylase RimI-like enzyme